MTPSAWVMLGVSWSVIFFFTGKFFWMVLTARNTESPDEPDDRDIREDA